MINIIINEELIDNKAKFIATPFKRIETVFAYENGISKEVENIIKTVDGCKLDKNRNVESKFTNTPISIDSISEGCKNVIYVYFRARLKHSSNEEIIDITGCGPNAIEYILNNYRDADLNLYLGHLEFPRDIKCDFMLNGKVIHNTDEIFE